jgi:hypothetical protein
MKIKKRFKNQQGFALGLVIVIIAAFTIMTTAFFFYNDLELAVFNNAKKDRLNKASANLGIETAYKDIQNGSAQNFNFLSPSVIANSICIGGIDNSAEYIYQQSRRNLSADFSSDDYADYGYEYFIRRTIVDDNNIDYTVISCATFNSNAVTYLSLNLTTSLIEGSDSNTVVIKRLGSGNIAF